MSPPVDIEISIRRQQDGSYTADLRMQMPESAAVVDLAAQVPVFLNSQALREVRLDTDMYGARLATMLFADEELCHAWSQACGYADGHASPLRVRLHLDRSAATLHSLCWEMLHDLTTKEPLALSERTIFSRMIASSDLTPVIIPSRPELRALIVVSNPHDLPDYGLTSVDVRGEVARTVQALGSIPTTIVGDHPDAVAQRATLPTIIEHLRDAPHILYLVCHGTLVGGIPYLWLEQRDGASDRVPGSELVTRMRGMIHRPLLVALASCASAGEGNADALAALGPQLARAGVAAVLAMQGKIPVATIEHLMPTFFRELCRDGLVDRALAAARVAVRGDPAWWMPVLFLQARDGRLWSDVLTPADLRRARDELGTYLVRALAAHKSWLEDALPRMPKTPTQPYRSLFAFGVEDAALFFGRDSVLHTVAERVMTSRLLVLHARSGAGKSSLLNAGLIPYLFNRSWLPIIIRTGRDPLGAVKAVLSRPSVGPWPAVLTTIPFSDLLGLICQQGSRSQQPLVVIFDQFEELFTLQPDPDVRARFATDLAICLADIDLPVHIVLSLRGDYLTDLDSLAVYVPSILDNRYLLAPMGRSDAEAAITQPLSMMRPSRSYDPALLCEVLDDLEGMGMELPHLQIICTRLSAGLRPEESLITQKHYQRLGGAPGILGGYLRQEVEALGRDAGLARAILIVLVAPDQTRQKLDADSLREQMTQRSDLDHVNSLLGTLVTIRLLHQETHEGVMRYELAHDYLIGEVRAWVTPEDLAARQARDALRRALADWREQHGVMHLQTLVLVHAHREYLTGLTAEECELLLRSAVAHHYAIEVWAHAAHRGGSDIWPVLHPLLNSPDHAVRASVVAMLGVLGAEAIPYLRAALRDPIASVRVQAIRALSRMIDPAATTALSCGLWYEVRIPPLDTMPAFYIDRYPVTNDDYAVFLADRPDYPPPDDWESGKPSPPLATHPVVGVSWHEAVAFAAWAGKRLPTVSEWQRTAGWPERRYPWGEHFLGGVSNTREANRGATSPVGVYSPAGDSPYGVADMAGNSWEWLADPAGPEDCYRTLRGGGWRYSADFACSDFDGFWQAPDQRQSNIGFRLCFHIAQEEQTHDES